MKLSAAIFNTEVSAVQIDGVFQSTILKRNRRGFPLVRSEQLLALIKGRFKMQRILVGIACVPFFPAAQKNAHLRRFGFLALRPLKCR